MEAQFLEKIKYELINGYSKKRHPFRYFTLATIQDDSPTQRTVVLRKLLNDFTLLFYTDSRTNKMKDFEKNPAFSALFYHPKQLFQVRCSGNAKIITDKNELLNYWNKIPENSRKDYITAKTPSTTIDNPDHVMYLEDKNYFTAIQLIPDTIEFLQLKRPNHLRIQYTKKENNWVGEFLVP